MTLIIIMSSKTRLYALMGASLAGIIFFQYMINDAPVRRLAYVSEDELWAHNVMDNITTGTVSHISSTAAYKVPEPATSRTTSSSRSPSSLCPADNVVKSFALVKIGKTGTTTMRTTFLRFIYRNQLSEIKPAAGSFLDWRRDKGYKMYPVNSSSADALLSHAMYNPTMLDKLMTTGYKLIVPTRHPVSWFKSAVTYYKTYAKIPTNSPSKVMQNKKYFYTPRKDGTGLATWFHIPQLQWLGFNYTHRDNRTAIKQFISWVIPRIDVIMLNDQFDASLLILRRRFCWQYTDIFYRSGKVSRSAKSSQLSKNQTNELLSLNYGDLMLYEALNTTWWSQPEIHQNDLWGEVEHFQQMNSQISLLCRKVTPSHPVIIEPSRWHEVLNLTYEFCRGYNCNSRCKYLDIYKPGYRPKSAMPGYRPKSATPVDKQRELSNRGRQKTLRRPGRRLRPPPHSHRTRSKNPYYQRQHFQNQGVLI